jgi:hypothetical protein
MDWMLWLAQEEQMHTKCLLKASWKETTKEMCGDGRMMTNGS